MLETPFISRISQHDRVQQTVPMTFRAVVFTVRSIPHPHSLPFGFLQKSRHVNLKTEALSIVRGTERKYLEVLPGIQGLSKVWPRAAVRIFTRCGLRPYGRARHVHWKLPHALVR